ncbi:MAG: histidine--tRNA ligase [Chloroflexi bacterium]|nr:histidine--tRNA ligase [Chloroflexota bacterium]
MILRQYVTGKLRDVFENFGFEPLDTPAIEYAEVLEGKYGDEADKLIYKFEDRGGRRIGLRYDLTVPLARVIGTHPDLARPFKRYQIAPVWRAEKPQKGRYREFWQCDVDTVGSASSLADAEVVCVAYDALRRLGFRHFKTKINSRKMLAAIAEYIGLSPDQAPAVYRAIDKLDKIGIDGVKEELAECGLNSPLISRLLDLLQVRGDADVVLAQLRTKLADSAMGAQGVDELDEVVRYLRWLGVSESNFEVDFSMVRGLDYYTGPIFETVVEEPKIGSICGGGRYDGLVGLFTNRPTPATGISLGLERIVDVLEELHLGGVPEMKTVTYALVTVFSQDTVGESLRAASELRAADIHTEVFLGKDKLGNQLRYASRKGIPFTIILGPDEIATGKAIVKNIATEEQVTIERAELVDWVLSKHEVLK